MGAYGAVGDEGTVRGLRGGVIDRLRHPPPALRAAVVLVGLVALAGCLDAADPRSEDNGTVDGDEAVDADDDRDDRPTDGDVDTTGTGEGNGRTGDDQTGDDQTGDDPEVDDWTLPPVGDTIPSDDERLVYLVLEAADPAACEELLGTKFVEEPPADFITGPRSYHLYRAAAHLCARDRDGALVAFGQVLSHSWTEPADDRRNRRWVCDVWDAVTSRIAPDAGPCTLETTDVDEPDDEGGETDAQETDDDPDQDNDTVQETESENEEEVSNNEQEGEPEGGTTDNGEGEGDASAAPLTTTSATPAATP
jgi:hypothetical protein